MTRYLVPSYLSCTSEGGLEREAALARAGAERLAATGTRVRHVRSLFVPADEACLLLFEAGGEEEVRAAAAMVGLRYDRIVVSERSSVRA